MRHHQFEIYTNTDDEIVIRQSRFGFDEDDIVVLNPDQIEAFINCLKATANSLKRDASRREEEG